MSADLYTKATAALVLGLARQRAAKTGNRVDADELFSAAEYRIARKLPEFDGARVPFRAWVVTQARWAFEDHIRSLRTYQRRSKTAVTVVSADEMPAGYIDFMLGGVEDNRFAFLHEAVALLPAKDREVVEALLRGELKQDIAAASGVTPQAVSARMHGICRKLRRIIEDRPAPAAA